MASLLDGYNASTGTGVNNFKKVYTTRPTEPIDPRTGTNAPLRAGGVTTAAPAPTNYC